MNTKNDCTHLKKKQNNKRFTAQVIKDIAYTSELVPFGFMIVEDITEGGKIIDVNSLLYKSCGCTSKEEFFDYTEGKYSNLIWEEDISTVKSKLHRADEGEAADPNDDIDIESYLDLTSFGHIYYRIVTRDGRDLHVEDTCCRTYDLQNEDGSSSKLFVHYFAFSDENRNQNIFDLVTGLHQRDYIYKWIEDQYIFNKSYFDNHRDAAVYINCRGFRQYNEMYGYDAGDKLLRTIGREIQRCFDTSLVARHGGDRFVAFCSADIAEDAAERLHKWGLSFNREYSLYIVTGIYNIDQTGTGPAKAANFAKMACDHIRVTGGNFFSVYTPELAKSIEKKEYIQTHIDEAISKGWLQFYLQPVVRTLTNKVCSEEALSRWIDPVYGMISPGEFVPALEEKGLSYKLALFVIDGVAKFIKSRVDSGKSVVPISINFSRNDFDMIDPYEEVEKAVLKYNVQRRLICIEITESMAMENPERIKKTIERFHEAGYEVWMDDFGSAYSSLNTLKDFEFDEIKLDMAFMKDLNDRSREIIVSCVNMAKNLSIHTLCEGVETSEQVEFLRDVGCEKIQGFYYSKPRNPADLISFMEEKCMELESPSDRFLYDSIGNLEFDTDRAWAIVRYSGSSCRFDYCSKELRDNASERGYRGFVSGAHIDPESGYGERVYKLIRDASASNDDEEISYFTGGHYFSVSARVLASFRDDRLCIVNFRDTTEESRQLLLARADLITQSLINMYDSIYLVDKKTNELQIILSSFPMEKAGKHVYFDTDFARSFVYWKDRERFGDWINKYVSGQRRTEFGVFRFMRPDKTHSWKVITVIPYISNDPKDRLMYLICLKPYPDVRAGRLRMEEPSFPAELNTMTKGAEGENSKFDLSALWNALRDQDVLKIFWKDKERRFRGVSKAFLNYYGIKSEKEILGKTDDEIGWNTDVTAFRDVELDVLKTGKTVYRKPGRNFVNGQIHDISATKFPITWDGQIVGLMGYFFDQSEIHGAELDVRNYVSIDGSTGMMTFEKWLSSLSLLENNYIKSGIDYMVVMISMNEYWDIRTKFGIELAEKMADNVAKVLKKDLDDQMLIARIDLSTFVIADRETETDPDEKNSHSKFEIIINGLVNAKKELSKEMWLDDSRHCRVTLICGGEKRTECSDVLDVLTKTAEQVGRK